MLAGVSSEGTGSDSGRANGGVALFTSEAFEGHETGPRHPERADRIRAVHEALRRAGLMEGAAKATGVNLEDGGTLGWSSVPLVRMGFGAATDADLELCHTARHIAAVREACGRLRAGEVGLLDAGDTPICRESEEIARLSAGAVLAAVDAVLGETGGVRRAFVAGRPPGHHAEPERAQGFCLYSNVALAARHAIRRHGLSRVAVVDFDVHHGNGTQACFETDPAVFFASLHQHPTTCYPGTGFEWETGTGPAKGTKLNVPLPPRSGNRAYLAAMREKVIPRLREFGPELLLISAGFDAHMDDPLADMQVTDEGFGELTALLVEAGRELCGGRIVSVLEGGYHLPALGRSVVRHVVALQG